MMKLTMSGTPPMPDERKISSLDGGDYASQLKKATNCAAKKRAPNSATAIVFSIAFITSLSLRMVRAPHRRRCLQSAEEDDRRRCLRKGERRTPPVCGRGGIRLTVRVRTE